MNVSIKLTGVGTRVYFLVSPETCLDEIAARVRSYERLGYEIAALLVWT